MELACDNKMDVICQYISLFTCICNECMCVYILGEFEDELEREALKATLLPALKMQRIRLASFKLCLCHVAGL